MEQGNPQETMSLAERLAPVKHRAPAPRGEETRRAAPKVVSWLQVSFHAPPAPRVCMVMVMHSHVCAPAWPSLPGKASRQRAAPPVTAARFRSPCWGAHRCYQGFQQGPVGSGSAQALPLPTAMGTDFPRLCLSWDTLSAVFPFPSFLSFPSFHFLSLFPFPSLPLILIHLCLSWPA